MAKVTENLKAIKRFLNSNDWKYQERTFADGQVTIATAVSAENIDFQFNLILYKEDVVYYAALPNKVDEKKKLDVSIRLNEINANIKYGKFYYDLEEGLIKYEYCLLTDNVQVTEATVKKMILSCSFTIDNNVKSILNALVANQE